MTSATNQPQEAIMRTFDDALAVDAALYTESEAEREERHAVEAGNEWPLLSDSERTARDDQVAEDMAEAERDWLFGHGDRPTWTYSRPAADWHRLHAADWN